MSERKANKQIYELSSKFAGTETVERVPRQLRKGVPDEYSKLLQEARAETNELVEQQLKKAAKRYVPKLYGILKDAGYEPFNARMIIVADCKSIWAKAYVETYLPTETKDQRKAVGAKKMVDKRRTKIETEKKNIKNALKPIIPDATDKEVDAVRKHPRLVGLAAASPETRARVAKAGGDAKYEQHPEEFSEMGHESADKWTKLKEQYQTLQVEIEDEEHKQIVNAYQESLAMRANGTGGYVLFIKNGDYEKVEATNGTPAKTVNK